MKISGRPLHLRFGGLAILLAILISAALAGGSLRIGRSAPGATWTPSHLSAGCLAIAQRNGEQLSCKTQRETPPSAPSQSAAWTQATWPNKGWARTL